MTSLLGPNGQPISSKTYNKKANPPETGEKYGVWGGPNVSVMQLPGGGAIQFNLDELTLGDYRQMTDHYQINSSLTVLTFLLHQIDWRVKCGDKKQEDFYEEALSNIWTPLVRSKSTAFWAGFSPNVIQWQNDVPNRKIVIDKIKDLIPEDVEVKWKVVDGHRDGNTTHKIAIYDGIKQFGGPPIPVENTYWYPLLMKNGDMRGTKLLRSAFQPWFFSLLVHLFANRYYERFGEPTPIGRAPYEDEIRFDGKEMRGNEAMALILNQLRSRAAVVLPNEKTPFGDETTLDYDYQIEYLESQMRGADFERYLTRLDEEMSLALFTPILMMRTADVGSYNLGTQHNVTYKMLLNTLFADWKYYIDWYLLRPLRDYNFGLNAPMPKFIPRKMGADQEKLLQDIVTSLVTKGGAKIDLEQAGEMLGISVSEVRQLTTPAADPAQAGSDAPASTGGSTESGSGASNVLKGLSDRIEQQVRNAYRDDRIQGMTFSLGFQRQMENALEKSGVKDAHRKVMDYYASIEQMLEEMTYNYKDPDSFMMGFQGSAQWRLEQILKDAA